MWSFFQPLYMLCAPMVIAIALHCYSASTDVRARRRGLSLPPGPKRWPLFGNLFNAPSSWKPWLGYRKLTAQYGDIVYLEVLGRPMVVLGSPGIIYEFLEKRSAITSDRPDSPLFSLVGQQDNIGMQRYGSKWRRLRRAFWQYFHSGVVPTYQPQQESLVRKALARFLEQTSDVKEVIHYAFGSAILKLVYDIDAEDERDWRVTALDAAFDGVHAITAPVQFVFEMLPFLSRLPTWTPKLGTFIKRMSDSRAAHRRIATELNDYAKIRADDSSIVCKLLSRAAISGYELDEEEEEMVIPAVAAVAAEGERFTSSTAEGFFLAIALHPEVQKKARVELDAVVGPGRLPDFNDRKDLVYVNAVVQEALRWHTVLPLGMIHMTTEDSELRGQFIPAGTLTIANVWACMHNPDLYPEPDVFNPDRFVRDGKLRDDVLNPTSIIFGFGRRCCPGRHYADAILYIIIATVLHVFDVSPPLDEDGRPISINYEQSHGFISFPEDFRCVVKPRSAQAASLLRDSLANEDP
ncbi:O-methylsterigmatocystin oxidoreductase [Cubamyces menziesii]|nr:O-methylsterigmatocystin oxidoreductase [Cubamyces menziesii]